MEETEAADDTEAETETETENDAEADEESEAEDAEDSDDKDTEVIAETDDDDDIPFGRKRKTKGDKSGLANRSWRQYLRRGALPLLLLISLGINGFFGWQQWQQRQLDQAGQEAQQAAVNYAQVLTSIDSNNVDENFRQVLDGATGEFKDMYTQSSVQLRQLLIDNKATAHGVVIDSAIQSKSTDKVIVLVFIDQTVTNTAAPDPRIDRSRIKMTMEKVDGRWKAAKVQLL
ncbi:tetratricopeptide repeat protein [Mycobacterium bourgelatii]|nr:tetratricopeptide repeat protein [Mycobacterium bourgelatii]MCV6975817.1 tetratricopeptide repeat protein [Mycobacterium bourgelatii]